MKGHAFTAYLRVYQPLAAFPPRERAEWAAYVEAGQVLPASLLVGREERRGGRVIPSSRPFPERDPLACIGPRLRSG